MLSNCRILQPGNSVIFQMAARHLNDQRKQEIMDILSRFSLRYQDRWSYTMLKEILFNSSRLEEIYQEERRNLLDEISKSVVRKPTVAQHQ